MDAACDIICFQETKKEAFDASFIKKICPSAFDRFESLPSVGASGGILTAWKNSLFSGELVFSNEYAISVEFTSRHSNDSWIVTNVFGPCTVEGKRGFTDWLKQIEMPEEIEWLIMGDFNLMRKPEDRNREGGILLQCLCLMML